MHPSLKILKFLSKLIQKQREILFIVLDFIVTQYIAIEGNVNELAIINLIITETIFRELTVRVISLKLFMSSQGIINCTNAMSYIYGTYLVLAISIGISQKVVRL